MAMKTQSDPIEIIDEETIYTLHEICERFGIRGDFIVELVDYGVITPLKENSAEDWIFDAAAVARMSRALRLQHDLEINLPGIAISLDLLDDVQRLRRQVSLLDRQLKQLLGD